jgi:hypothetical protein
LAFQQIILDFKGLLIDFFFRLVVDKLNRTLSSWWLKGFRNFLGGLVLKGLNVRKCRWLIFVGKHEWHGIFFIGIRLDNLDIEFFFFFLDKFFLFIDLILIFLNTGEKDFLADDLGDLFRTGLLDDLGSPVFLRLGFLLVDGLELVVGFDRHLFVGPFVDLLFG